ncbi:MAG: hypothetical protein OEY85_10970 [Rhodospirillales bacterium]|nr:hypothetical protein [Rhodospirillales bacterium]
MTQDKLPHFTEAPEDLRIEFPKVMNKFSLAAGRKNTREERIDWPAINSKVADWWKEKGYRFP